MVKFSKQLEGQLIPEWRNAYCNYWQLKKDLKQIKLDRQKTTENLTSPRRSSLHSINSFTRRRSVPCKDFIDVHHTLVNTEDAYETQILEPTSGGVEKEAKFFKRLDDQLIKINKFYRSKEIEFLQRGDLLTRQVKMLVEARSLLRVTNLHNNGEENSKNNTLHNLQEFRDSNNNIACSGPEEIKAKAMPGLIMTNIDILPQLSMNLSSRTLYGIDGQLSKRKVQYAEKMLRSAFIEFYRGLGLLRTYSSLNMVAFAKILKKFDKVTGWNTSAAYLKVVEQSYFNSSDKVLKLMDEIETLFIEHFARKNRKYGMSCLRPSQQKASHTITFLLGLFTGCSLALFAAFLIVVHLSGEYASASTLASESSAYMKSIFPTFSMLALILLHMSMYGWNIYLWRQTRINYAFIFEFAPGTELRHREILVVTMGLTTILIAGMVIHLFEHAEGKPSFLIDLIPLGVALVFLAILISPFNLFYRSSRMFFLNCMRKIIFAPLYKVVLADFFLADQLTSQVAMLRNLTFVLCYYLGRHFKFGKIDSCTRNMEIIYVVSVLPYFWRLMQCLRRWKDERTKNHIANGGKYFSTMVAVATRLTYSKRKSHVRLGFLIVTSTIATLYQLYWDLVIDWGLLQPHSINRMLRDKLILRRKFIYFISMAANTGLRFIWLQSVTNLNFGTLDHYIVDFILAALEVIRRGHWNFYRLENEHLNNVGNYRAVKTVPLPFRDVEGGEA